MREGRGAGCSVAMLAWQERLGRGSRRDGGGAELSVDDEKECVRGGGFRFRLPFEGCGRWEETGGICMCLHHEWFVVVVVGSGDGSRNSRTNSFQILRIYFGTGNTARVHDSH